MSAQDEATDSFGLQTFERWMHEVARRRRVYKAKGNKLLKSLNQDYYERLAKKLDGTKYGLKKKKVKKKTRNKPGPKPRLIYDKFSRPRKHNRPILEKQEQ